MKTKYNVGNSVLTVEVDMDRDDDMNNSTSVGFKLDGKTVDLDEHADPELSSLEQAAIFILNLEGIAESDRDEIEEFIRECEDEENDNED